jgi:GNAT superfamily N-acetyltransferase
MDSVLYEARPCLVCNGSGFSGFGTGYGDVCDNCIAGELPAAESLGKDEIRAVLRRRMQEWELCETLARFYVKRDEVRPGRWFVGYGDNRGPAGNYWSGEFDDGEIFFLTEIGLDPDQRGHGHGEALYDIITEIARDLGCTEIRQMPSGWTRDENGINVKRSRRDYLHDRGWVDVEEDGDVCKILKENTVNGVVGEPNAD